MSDVSIDSVMSAIEDWMEAKQSLKQMQGEYTGYSSSYHLHSWHEAEEKTRKIVEERLDAYIDARIDAKIKKD